MLTYQRSILTQPKDQAAPSEDEPQLIREAQKEPAAFEPLYNRYYKEIYTFVFFRVQDYNLAGELTSTVFFNALRKIKTYRDKGLPFSAWLYKIALNECHQHFRKTAKTRLVPIDIAQAHHLSEELLSAEEREEQVSRFIQELPRLLHRLKAQERSLIELRFFANKPYQEIAYLLGISTNLAKVKTHRTLKKMKKLIGNYPEL